MAKIHATMARTWIGTPYIHQASAKGQGCDCLGLVRGVWREAIGEEPVSIPPYTPSWTECTREEKLWQAAMTYLRPVDIDLGGLGDVVLFRMKSRSVAKHLGILSGACDTPRMVHALSGRCVLEAPLTPEWRGRIVAQFAFPLEKL
ncbi:MAG: peptidase [Pseudomonadota bacterium]